MFSKTKFFYSELISSQLMIQLPLRSKVDHEVGKNPVFSPFLTLTACVICGLKY